MLEHTDNDLPNANEENVSESTSTPTPESNENTDAATDNEPSTNPVEVKNITVEAKTAEDKPEENQLEENAELKGETASKTLKKEQFEAMDANELLDFFANVLKNESVQHLKPTVEPLVKVFSKKMAELEAKNKEAFISDGGNPDAFYFNPEIKKKFNHLYKRYKSDRGTYFRSLDEKQQNNLKVRLGLIEELKGLINVEQDINATYKQFKDLQGRWKECGQVPRMAANNIWKTYHHHVGHFYDFLHLNRELRELDFKFNLEQKLIICEKAEALASMEDISKAFRNLQNLHKKWKDELGPVSKDRSEEVWERFSNATKVIHDKRRYFLKNQEEIFEENLLKKQAILIQIQELCSKEVTIKTNIHKYSKTYESLRESFLSIGKVPTKKRDDLWAEFKKTSRKFSRNRNLFYKQLKKTYAENIAKRKELISKAEEIKSQGNLKENTSKIIALQKEWKTIGPVGKRDSTTLWEAFRGVCNEYFSLLDASMNSVSKEEQENLAQKTTMLDELKKGLDSADDNFDIDTILKKWNNVGRVPRNKSKIEHEFNKLVEKAYKAAGLSKAEITKKSYQNKLDNMRGNDDVIRKESYSLNRRIEDIKQEIIQLETNLQFFGKNQEKNPIVVKVRQDIAKHQERLDELVEKKRLLKRANKG